MNVQHPIRAEDLDLLALGVVDGDECKDLRAHIAFCPECAANFAAAQGRVALFALAAPPQNPPPSVRESLFSKIRAEISAPGIRSENFELRTTRSAVRWWSSLWVPATAILAIATLFLWINDRRMNDEMQQMRGTEQMFEQAMHHERALVSFFSAQDTQAVSLAPKSAVPKSSWARVKYNSRLGMVCYTGDLPTPPPHSEYQMWIVPMVGNPINAGTFMPASFNNGRMCMAKMPEGISCKSFAVTVEPMGGMPHPTGPQVLSGGGL